LVHSQVIRRLGLVLLLGLLLSSLASAQDIFDFKNFEIPDLKIEPKKTPNVSNNLQMSFFLISLSLIPYLIVCCTSFIRTTIMLSYLKSALGSTQALSNQLLMGITMFITFFIMYPVGERMNATAIQPYLAGTIEQADFAQKLTLPVREFMIMQTREQDLLLFCRLGKLTKRMTRDQIPFRVILPAFIMSEVKTGFFIGFLIYIPFLVVDMVVASVLMSMGMFMISPTTISLPFKLVLFCSLDGWHVLINGLVKSFNRPEWMGGS
jgi:flagellar biosynthesis protein FliP